MNKIGTVQNFINILIFYHFLGILKNNNYFFKVVIFEDALIQK